MRRDELKKEVSERIDNLVDENRELSQDDIDTLCDDMGEFIQDIVDDDEATPDEPEGEEQNV